MHWNYSTLSTINWSVLMIGSGMLVTYLLMKYKSIRGIIKNITDFNIK
ncbi:hypothetical protein [Companilactobacillus jidongensis]|nr:hypothetical protein [Companilactobacillus jidongensis]